MNNAKDITAGSQMKRRGRANSEALFYPAPNNMVTNGMRQDSILRRRNSSVTLNPSQKPATLCISTQPDSSVDENLTRTGSIGEVPIELHEVADHISSNANLSHSIYNNPNSNVNSHSSVGGNSEWRLLSVENGLRLFEERSYLSSTGLESELASSSINMPGRSMRAVTVVKASPDSVFRLVMSYEDCDRGEWDFVLNKGQVIETIDGHTDLVYEELRPVALGSGLAAASSSTRCLFMLRYWRRDADGSYVVMYRSTEDEAHTAQIPPVMDGNGRYSTEATNSEHNSGIWNAFSMYRKRCAFRKAEMMGGAFIISPLKRGYGVSDRTESVVAHWLEMDPLGWVKSLGFTREYMTKILMRLAGLREFLDQTGNGIRNMLPSYIQHQDDVETVTDVNTSNDKRVEENGKRGRSMKRRKSKASAKGSSRESSKLGSGRNRNFIDTDDEDDDNNNNGTDFEDENSTCPSEFDYDEDYIMMLREKCCGSVKYGSKSGRDGYAPIRLRNCWIEPKSRTFNIRSKTYLWSKIKEPSLPSHLHLVAVDWLRCAEKIKNIASHPEHPVQKYLLNEKNVEYILVFNMQAPASQHYSLVLYYVSLKPIEADSLLGRFIHGSDDFRDARMKLLPNVAVGPWIVQRGVGRTPLIVGSALKVNYHITDRYFEADIDIGTSSVACGITRFVIGYVRHLVIDLGLVVQGNCEDELPERLLGQIRIVHLELKSAQEYKPFYDSQPLTPTGMNGHDDSDNDNVFQALSEHARENSKQKKVL